MIMPFNLLVIYETIICFPTKNLCNRFMKPLPVFKQQLKTALFARC